MKRENSLQSFKNFARTRLVKMHHLPQLNYWKSEDIPQLIFPIFTPCINSIKPFFRIEFKTIKCFLVFTDDGICLFVHKVVLENTEN